MAASDPVLPLALAASRAESSQSKRDRKRQVVMERLAALTDKFQHDKDSAYRDQLQRIQLELNKLQKFDPYASNAVEVAGEVQREYKQATAMTVRAENARSLMDMAGLQFPQFMSDVQDVLEARDYQLTQSKNDYERKVQQYKNTHIFKMETAKREHHALNSTMRDRLVNHLNTKKARLVKEKEAFETSDSHALLLNPNQFHLPGPGSPGGHPGKRSTRNRKEAADNHDGFGESKKRKRNAGDDDGSPAPTRRALDPSVTTPYWQSEKARIEARKQGPPYSLASLFTEKELSMHYNTAALASHNHILRHRSIGNDSSASQGISDSGNADHEAGDGDAQLQPPSSSAPAMERQPSHATRSTRVAAQSNFSDDKLFGIEGIGTFELPSNLDLMHGPECTPKMPAVPPYPPYTKVSSKGEQSLPNALSEKEVAMDFQIMACLKQYDVGRCPGSHLDNPKGLRKTFEAIATPYQAGRFMSLAKVSRENEAEVLRESFGVGLPTSSVRDQSSPGRGVNGQATGGTPMSRQSSAGGVAMSRQGTAGSGRTKTRRG
ncbi:hypothetical protein CDD80_3233 [Ophiocordyceps camponoti-rufipedis]|uniref:Deacetylase complex subunit Sds3 n=1 Tax=Ophiocordyceps camponoti-rufipedis TaxID=2004952 RepID=A0A2C5Y821_9HYPO|nr:hypothetical protein CDD80_3233 [Ophiocordyceps camponoti-rufipedis]